MAEELPGFASRAARITLDGTGGREGSVRDGDTVVLCHWRGQLSR